MGLLTSKAKIVITFNRGYTTLSQVELNLDSNSYAIGRASNEIELGSGDEKLIRQRIEKEVAANPMQVKSILNGQRELQNIPAVYITPHNVHGKKIVFAPYIVSISRDIGFLTWDKTEYQFTSSGPSTGILINGIDTIAVNKGETKYLHHCDKLQDGEGVFEITIYY